MVEQLRLARRTKLTRTRANNLPVTTRQLDLILDDTRLRGVTLVERQAVLKALAGLLLEANGLAKREVSDDNA
jgi:hypothetical protein